MKAYGKLMAGLLALAVGGVGVGFCLTFVLQIRQTSARLEREIPQTLEHIEQIAQSVRSQGEATTQVLGTTQERVTYLGETIEQLSKKLTDREKTSSLLLVLDEDIDTQLDNARQFVLSMQNSMRNLGSTLLLFDSMSIFGANPFPRGTESTGLRQENALRTVAQG